ncbi:unnamed protein product, partial [Ectocarpus sp. 4 AP-2014]
PGAAAGAEAAGVATPSSPSSSLSSSQRSMGSSTDFPASTGWSSKSQRSTTPSGTKGVLPALRRLSPSRPGLLGVAAGATAAVTAAFSSRPSSSSSGIAMANISDGTTWTPSQPPPLPLPLPLPL